MLAYSFVSYSIITPSNSNLICLTPLLAVLPDLILKNAYNQGGC